MAGRFDYTIDAGSDYEIAHTFLNDDDTPFDLTDYTAEFRMRRRPRSLVQPGLQLSSPTDIVMGGVAGTAVVVLNHEHTADFNSGEFDYNFKLIDGDGKVVRTEQGTITVDADVL